jgi:probable rRNA maturation factor
MRNISVSFNEIPRFYLDRNQLSSCIKDIIETEARKAGKVAIIFCNDDYLIKVNNEYLNHDYYTDIITFNYNNGSIINGDLLISVERVKENAELYKDSFERELFRVIFHGILHLIGYDDKDENSEKTMRMKEDFYLKKFDI